MHCTGYSVSLIQLKVKMKCINCPITTLLTSTVTLSMEDGGVDRTVIDCQQNQLAAFFSNCHETSQNSEASIFSNFQDRT